MKIKFIPKKHREQIKQIKQKSLQQEIHKKIQDFSSIKSGKINKINQNDKNTIIQQNIDNQIKENQVKNQQQNEIIDQEQQYKQRQIRQRSRELKQKNKKCQEQLNELDAFKKKYLGLNKCQQSNRNSLHYKTKLQFQWDKSQDTFQQSGYLGTTIIKANQKFGKKIDDMINREQLDSWKNKKFEEMTERDWRIFREDNQIFIKGGRVSSPLREWSDGSYINTILLQNLRQIKYEKPRPIQMQAIPIGLEKRDLIAIAPTGEGKTLAYLIPIINFVIPLQRIVGTNSQKGPYAIILSPSRQLAQQIEAQFNKISKGLNLSCIRLVGGKQIQMQSISLWKGADLIIGTPGRIKQMVEKRHLSLQRLSWVVIDEADKMISQNLSQQIEYILQHSSSQSVLTESLGRDKIIHMFSATMVPEIQKLIKSYLANNACYITIGEPGGGKKEIEQYVDLMPQQSKSQKLGKVLRNLPGPIIVFVNQRDSCQSLATKIQERWKRTVGEYHGGKNQQTRQKIISQFRSGKIQILVATDLAGRGLDVKGINAVINYDAPKNISEFIHRAGRTGRAGMKGKCFTFLTAADQNIFYDLRVLLQKNEFRVPQNLRDHPAAIVRPGTVLSVPRRKQIVYTN